MSLIATAALTTAPAHGFLRAEIIRPAVGLLARIPAQDSAGHEPLQRALINAPEAIEDTYGQQPPGPAHQ